MAEFGFELGRRLVAQRGVQALAVVDSVDEAADVAPCFVEPGIGLAVHLFGLERLHEALGLGFEERAVHRRARAVGDPIASDRQL